MLKHIESKTWRTKYSLNAKKVGGIEKYKVKITKGIDKAVKVKLKVTKVGHVCTLRMNFITTENTA